MEFTSVKVTPQNGKYIIEVWAGQDRLYRDEMAQWNQVLNFFENCIYSRSAIPYFRL